MKIQQFNVNRSLLLMMGLWPYRRSIFVRVQSILFLSILITHIISVFTTFLATRCTIDIFLKSTFTIFFFVAVTLMYLPFYMDPKITMCLFDQMQYSYDELKDDTEIAIINKHWFKTKRHTILCVLFAICAMFIFALVQLWPLILDVVLPINKTRQIYQIELLTGNIVNREKYLYLITLHGNVAAGIGTFAVFGTGTVFFGYFQHMCGLFRITSHRIQYTVMVNTLHPTSLKKGNLIYRDVIRAIDIHRKTMQFIEYFLSKYAVLFASLVMIGVLSISLNLYYIFEAVTTWNLEELTICLLILFGQYLYMFMVNYVAQEVTDHNNQVYATVYNVRWYLTPLRVQKMMLFLLQKGTKPYSLSLGGIIVGSLEGFATLMSATISYFTVIYSTRQ